MKVQIRLEGGPTVEVQKEGDTMRLSLNEDVFVNIPKREVEDLQHAISFVMGMFIR